MCISSFLSHLEVIIILFSFFFFCFQIHLSAPRYDYSSVIRPRVELARVSHLLYTCGRYFSFHCMLYAPQTELEQQKRTEGIDHLYTKVWEMSKVTSVCLIDLSQRSSQKRPNCLCIIYTISLNITLVFHVSCCCSSQN